MRRCEACGNGFTTPDLPSAAYELLPDVSHQELTASESGLLQWFISRRVLKIFSVSGRPTGTLLDIGGGACAFANGAARHGFAVTVIEPNEKNKSFADTSRGVRFIPEMFSSDLIHRGILAEHSFDLVTMWHSLEHTAEPREILKTVHALLKPGGILVISVPNLNGLMARVGGTYWAYLDVPHHLCHFTPTGLRQLVKQSGFRVQRQFGFSVEYDPFGWYQTLLNVLSRSQNFFYNRRKKRRRDEFYLRYPRWTKVVTALGPLLLPLVAVMTGLGFLLRAPGCVEIAARKESS